MPPKHLNPGYTALKLALVATCAFLAGVGMRQYGTRPPIWATPPPSSTPVVNPVGGSSVVAAADSSSSPSPIARLFVVGCGHSSTGYVVKGCRTAAQEVAKCLGGCPLQLFCCYPHHPPPQSVVHPPHDQHSRFRSQLSPCVLPCCAAPQLLSLIHISQGIVR